MALRRFFPLLAAPTLFALCPAVYAQDAAPTPAPATAPVVAPATNETIDADMMARIRDEGLNHSQLPQTLSYLTDVIGPRLTGSTNLKRANEWTRDTLSKWGLTNAHLEPWGPFGQGWALEQFSAQANVGPVSFPLIAYPKAWSPGWNGVRTEEVVFLNATDEAGLAPYKGKLKGKFVLVSPIQEVRAHFEAQGSRYSDDELSKLATAPLLGGGRRRNAAPGPDLSDLTPEQRAQLQARLAAGRFTPRRNQFLLEEGADLVLDAGRGDGGTVFVQQATVFPEPGKPLPPSPFGGPGAGGGPNANANAPRPVAVYSKEAVKRIVPQVAVSAEHYNRLVRAVQAGEKVTLSVGLKTHYEEPDKGMVFNTVAELPGTDKAGEVVMCGAHLDSWHGGTGATDNGAGSAACMEALRILKAVGAKPRRTIRVALWSGEEQGIFGSKAYVTEHFGTREAPKSDAQNISAYFNIDNGTGKLRGVWCQGNETVMPIFAAWLQPFADLGATTVSRRTTGGTDHLSFDAVGIPGFQFIQDTIEYDARTHHSNEDVYDRIQEPDLKQAATILAAFLYDTAMRDEKLPRKPAPPAVTSAAAIPVFTVR